jgi:ATP-dependent DNA helicase
LIAGPLSVLTNWVHEFHKWVPSCPTLLYHGSKQERQRLRQSKMLQKNVKTLLFPIVITSFEICMIDRRHLEKYQWQYIILDEGHRIKNRNCKLVRELKQIPSVSRILLTGTPIQNTLEELWSLLNFVNPQIFDNLEVFQAWFGFRNIGKETQVYSRRFVFTTDRLMILLMVSKRLELFPSFMRFFDLFFSAE